MPTGVYDRSLKLTADQKRERNAASTRNWCKKNRERANAIAKRAREKNKQKISAANKKWREKNREANLEQKRRHYAANRERLLKEKKEYTAATREKKSEYNARYRKENKERCRQNANRRRALIYNSTVGDRSAIYAWEKGWSVKATVLCHWCRKRIKTSDAHVDHVVPLAKGGAHAVENLCVSCAKCNHEKHAKLPDDWNGRLKQPLLFV